MITKQRRSFMFINFTLQFSDINGRPLKYKEVYVINYSNILSTTKMRFTDEKGSVTFCFFFMLKKHKDKNVLWVS